MIDNVPTEVVGEFSEWVPSRFTNNLNPHESRALVDAYHKFGGKVATDTLMQVYNRNIDGTIRKTHIGVPDTKSSIDRFKSAPVVHEETHQQLEQNSTKNFFKERLLAFDTETTSLNSTDSDFTKRGRIWQVGMAIAQDKGIDGLEEHVNPFFSYRAGKFEQTEKVRETILRDKLRKSNGQFSEKMYSEGKYEPFINLYKDNRLSSLSSALDKTLGQITNSDVIVLQNMNFENSMIRSAVDQGILKQSDYDNIARKMQTVGTNHRGNVTQLFQRPSEVIEKVRAADLMYHTAYLTSNSDEVFEKYKNTLNDAFDAYKTSITDPNRKGAVAVELQDITKTFLANAASEGYIDKKTATLGLNVDFLAKTILNQTESHTALSDSKQTIELLNNLSSMTEELRGNNVTEGTKNILSKIRSHQGLEVNRKFITSVRSVLSDFEVKGSSNIRGSDNWYQPAIVLGELSSEGSRNKITIPKVSLGNNKPTTSLSDALNNVLTRYSQYNDNLYSFDRKDYVSNIIKEHSEGASYGKLHNKVEGDYFNIKPPKELNTSENYVTNNLKKELVAGDYWNEPTSLFGKEMKKKTKATILGGLGVGLAAMAFQGRPEPVQKDYDNVSQNFYDDQYLGTAFVDFRERNKHYMM